MPIHTLTAGELSDALSKVPRHTPVVIKAEVTCPYGDDDDSEPQEFTTTCRVDAIRTHINCIELEARG